MDIGIGLDATLNLSFADQATLSQEAARLGYTSIWTPESTGQDAFQTPYVVGSADTVRSHINTVVEGAELDGLMLIFPDYHADLPAFGEAVLPTLRAQDAARASSGLVTS